jgi:hypothetical protein
MTPPDSASTQDVAPEDGRTETANERLDRNWNSLLQELRVTQTGTQIIGGFLLAVAFQTRFTELDRYQVTLYLTLVCVTALTTALGLGPVILHRLLFRQQAMAQIVQVGSVLVRVTLVGVAVVVSGTVVFIFDVASGRTAGLIAAAVVLLLIGLNWLILARAVSRWKRA